MRDAWDDLDEVGEPPAPDTILELEVTGPIRYWRGPSPFHFVTIPPDGSMAIAAIAREVTYGWGVIPVTVRLGTTTFRTSLFPRDGAYEVPIKASVRRAEGVTVDEVVTLQVVIGR